MPQVAVLDARKDANRAAKRANHVFQKLASNETVRRLGAVKYKFEFDAYVPVLVTVFLA